MLSRIVLGKPGLKKPPGWILLLLCLALVGQILPPVKGGQSGTIHRGAAVGRIENGPSASFTYSISTIYTQHL